MKILLIEDDVVTAELTRHALEPVKAEIKIAHSLLEGVHQLESFAPDIILLDLNLPDSNSFSTIHYIKRLSDKAALAVLTGSKNPSEKTQSLLQGADAFIVKDVLTDRAKFLEKIQEAAYAFEVRSGQRNIKKVVDQVAFENPAEELRSMSKSGRISKIAAKEAEKDPISVEIFKQLLSIKDHLHLQDMGQTELLRGQDELFKGQSELYEEAKKTNGRITGLEDWRQEVDLDNREKEEAVVMQNARIDGRIDVFRFGWKAAAAIFTIAVGAATIGSTLKDVLSSIAKWLHL
jgi:CheY-like chemotaxis protein